MLGEVGEHLSQIQMWDGLYDEQLELVAAKHRQTPRAGVFDVLQISRLAWTRRVQALESWPDSGGTDRSKRRGCFGCDEAALR